MDVNKKQVAEIGIKKIWVNEKHRKQKIATQLLDQVRIHFGYPCRLGKELLAMSQPTLLGMKFAVKYFEKNNFLVY